MTANSPTEWLRLTLRALAPLPPATMPIKIKVLCYPHAGHAEEAPLHDWEVLSAEEVPPSPRQTGVISLPVTPGPPPSEEESLELYAAPGGDPTPEAELLLPPPLPALKKFGSEGAQTEEEEQMTDEGAKDEQDSTGTDESANSEASQVKSIFCSCQSCRIRSTGNHVPCCACRTSRRSRRCRALPGRNRRRTLSGCCARRSTRGSQT